MKKLALVWILVLMLGLGVAWAEDGDVAGTDSMGTEGWWPPPSPPPTPPPLVAPPEPQPPTGVPVAGQLSNDEINTILQNIFGATPSSGGSKYSVETSVPYKVGDNNYYYCNSDPTITVNVSAKVKQWVYVSLSATNIKWEVFKPGTHWVDGITGIVASNGKVKITFAGFENLKATSSEQGDPTADEILVWYAKQQIFPYSSSPLQWIKATDLNGVDTIPENEDNHLYIWKLWNAIGVKLCDSAGDYADKNGATITVHLAESDPC